MTGVQTCALPISEFRRLLLQASPDIAEPFHFFARDLLGVITTLLGRFNHHLCDPRVRRASAEGTTDFFDGERFRRLQDRLTATAGDDAVLIPLVFNSGKVALFAFCFVCVMSCALLAVNACGNSF